MKSFSHASWETIEGLRAQVDASSGLTSLQASSERFIDLFATSFESVILARMFAVLPLAKLPSGERQALEKTTPGPLAETTRVLSLLASRGKQTVWNERENSVGHRAIPLLSSASVHDAPMIAKLLADLNVDLKALDDGRPIATRQMMGGSNGCFYVPDASSSVDELGRFIIPARDFVDKYSVRTVFGMGGSYLDGTLVVAIMFCSEVLDRLVVDRFPSFISSFKRGTSRVVLAGRLFEAAQL